MSVKKATPPPSPRAGAKRHTYHVNDQVAEPADRSAAKRRVELGDAAAGDAVAEPNRKKKE